MKGKSGSVKCGYQFVMCLISLALLIGEAVTLGQEVSSNEEKKVPLSEVPENIRRIIERELGDATIDDIQLGEKNGKKVYKVDAELPDGREIEVDVAENVMIVKKEIEVLDEENGEAEKSSAALAAESEGAESSAVPEKPTWDRSGVIPGDGTITVSWNKYEAPPTPPKELPANPRSSIEPFPVERPSFPARTVNVRDFGAKGDGSVLDSNAINEAITSCAAKGGGRVLIPPGLYVVGSIRLKSHIDLHLADSAFLIGVPFNYRAFDHYGENPIDPTCEWTSFTYNHWKNSLIYGIGLENIAITGKGVIHGGGMTRHGSREDNPPGSADKGITLKECRRVLLKDFTLIQGGHIAIMNMGCEEVAMENLKIQTTRDGVQIIGCRNLDLYNSYIEAVRYENGRPKGGDDAIVFKAMHTLGSRILTENVSVRNCTVMTNCNGVWFGSETYGDFRDIRVGDVRVLGADKSGIGISSNDGAVIENVTFKNITMEKCYMPICVRISNRRGRAPDRESDTKPGAIRNIRFENITAIDCAGLTEGRNSASNITGWIGANIDGIVFENVKITAKGGHPRENGTIIPKLINTHQPDDLGTQPAHAFRITCARGVEFRNVELGYETNDMRPALFAHKVNGLVLDHFMAQRSPNAMAAVRLIGVQNFDKSRSAKLATADVEIVSDCEVQVEVDD